MANPDNMAFNAMQEGTKWTGDEMLDDDTEFENMMSKVNLEDFNKLYMERYGEDKLEGQSDEDFLAGQERYQEMRPYFDPEDTSLTGATYREAWDASQKPRGSYVRDTRSKSPYEWHGDYMKRMGSARDYMDEMRYDVEEKKFTELYGHPNKYDQGPTGGRDVRTTFLEEGGYETWMRDRGYYDERKTPGAKGFLQRILLGGKEGKTRDFLDPALEYGDRDKTGSY